MELRWPVWRLLATLLRPWIEDAPIEIGHRLESVKLLSTDGTNEGDSKHHGYLTMEAVARPEVTAPDRRRIFEMAVTARDNRDRGRPTAWSAAVDRLASDAEADNELLDCL